MRHETSSDRMNFGFDSHLFMLGLFYKREFGACRMIRDEFDDGLLCTLEGTEYKEWSDFYLNDFKLKDYNDALYWTEWFDWEKEIFGGSHHFWLFRGWCLIELGRSDDALLDLKRYRASETDPVLRSAASLGMARVYFSEGKISSALNELSFILNTAPDDPFIREQVGKIILDHWINVIDSIRAEGQYREKFKQLELFPSRSQMAVNPYLSWIYQAWCEQGLGSLEDAITCLQNYISDESDPFLLRYAAICLLLTYQQDDNRSIDFNGLGLLTPSLPLDCDPRIDRSLYLARLYLTCGKMTEARSEIEFIRENITIDRFELLEVAESLFLECWDSEYNQLIDLGMYFEAFKWVESYNWKEDCPFGLHARWQYKAWCEMNLGWTEEAIDSYIKYIALETEPLLRAISSAGLAGVYSDAGQHSDAVEAVSAALRDAPDDPWINEQAKYIFDDFNDWFGGFLGALILLRINGYQIVQNNA